MLTLPSLNKRICAMYQNVCLFRGEGYFYFVHGYRATNVPEEFCLARTDYGESFASAIGRGSCLGVQFHPEKSQRAGLDLLERFCAWMP